jgi:SpoIID/LytB domain protein
MQITTRRRVAALVVSALLVGATSVVVATPASAADDGNVTFVGHGYGHGRGMGQYGAYGYAVDQGWSYQQILGRYYSNTTPMGAGNPTLAVELTRVAGADTIVTGEGLAVNGTPTGSGAVLVHRVSSGVFSVSTAPSCGGPWTQWGGTVASGATITDSDSMPTVCESAKWTAYHGSLRVVEAAGKQWTFNDVSTEDYLRGVIPRESPASWGDAGGGRGMQALMAQAVAARSYALAYGTRPSSGASICDSESCQVYGGAVEMPYGTGVVKVLEDRRTDAAVAGTAGVVLKMGGGGIARAEFSSSTGGWTAGGTFPAVEDTGDATASNPYHNWTTSIPATTVASALGTGPIRSMTVTSRNGLGADGGRVLTMVVQDTSGATKSFTGDQVRIALGLKSNWFTPTTGTRPAAEAVVRSLYQDVLNRQPDPAGLANWVGIVMTTNNPKLVADGIVNSKERLQALVTAEYVRALHRGPEPEGLAHWVAYMEQGATVSDLQIGVFASQESLNVLGGGDTRAWVAAMYMGLLGRPAAESEITGWYDVAVRYGRGAAVAGIAKSDEAGLQRLLGYYERYLGRGLDPSGIASWLPAMSGRGDFTIPGLIGGSQEYWNRSQTRF